MRWSTGGDLPTDYTFTGQRSEDASLPGLMDYRARYYDVYTNRFIQADTIVPEPGNSQAFNRYVFVYGNPLLYQDETGHAPTKHLVLGEGGSVVSPLTEYYGLRWEYDDDAPYDAQNWLGRDEAFEWFNEHPDYDPSTDPVMQNPEYYGVYWASAKSDIQGFYNDWKNR